ncbi:MAG: hypothetical protein CMJ84_09280 [Planctomycetes bacterium]|jgi:hypothetical protein|nr:hypothetical protein [Planctomycetota bacterium]MDP6407863.1 PDZ domain-containing protein [Planctomycetota bacterium]
MQRAPHLRRLFLPAAGHTACGALFAVLLAAGSWVPGAQPRDVQGQEPADARSSRLRAATEPLAHGNGFGVADWKRRLGQPDLDLREAAFEALLTEARTCAAARSALAVWSCSTAEPELAWTARLALRELDRAPLSGWQAAGPLIDPLVPGGDDLTGRLRSIEGLLAGVFDGGGGLSLVSPRHLSLLPQAGAGGSRRSYSVEVRPDGVRLLVTEDGNTREYEAPCLNLILEANPHLADEIPGLADMALQPFGSGTSLRWMDGPVRLRIDPLGWRRALEPGHRGTAGKLPTDILGIECGAPTAEERAACCVAPDCGILVRRVVPGTIADELGLRRGDVLVTLDGRAICAPAEISCLMGERTAGEPLVVEVADCRGGRRVLTWRPDDSD